MQKRASYHWYFLETWRPLFLSRNLRNLVFWILNTSKLFSVRFIWSLSSIFLFFLHRVICSHLFSSIIRVFIVCFEISSLVETSCVALSFIESFILKSQLSQLRNQRTAYQRLSPSGSLISQNQNNNKTSQNSKIPSKFDGDVVNFIVWNRRDILQDIFKIRIYLLQVILKDRQQADNFVGPKKKLTPNLMI